MRLFKETLNEIKEGIKQFAYEMLWAGVQTVLSLADIAKVTASLILTPKSSTKEIYREEMRLNKKHQGL